MVSKKQAILRVQAEKPGHTALSRQSFCPFRYANPSPPPLSTVATDVEEKLMQETESGEHKADMCQEFNLVNSTVQTIWKNRQKCQSFEKNNDKLSNYKRVNKVPSMKQC
jgi:hypothetical protein